MIAGTENPAVIRRRLLLEGCVQGMGFRPTVYRLAAQHAITGFVANTGGALCVEAQGHSEIVDGFLAHVKHNPPPQAKIAHSTLQSIPRQRDSGFVVRQSASNSTMPFTAPLPDIATCATCIAEVFDPDNRRYGYAFNSCVACGPRYTIQTGLPYDRRNTGMHEFNLCNECLAEFNDPADRRFHAQTVACPACGPRLSLLDQRGDAGSVTDTAPISYSIDALRAGAIVAIKGLGGFHLVTDAANDGAVAALRERKQRPHKPFALLMQNTHQVLQHTAACAAELQALQSPEAPIVLVKRRETGNCRDALSSLVAPQQHNLGIMLPYTPLHHILTRAFGAPLLVTSANRSGEPLLADNEQALEKLDGIADVFLLHDRPITNPVDDSVVQVVADRMQCIRLARGMAPVTIPVPVPVSVPASIDRTANQNAKPTLALGGHGKSSAAIAVAGHIINGPYTGDLDSELARRRFRSKLAQLQSLTGTEPQQVVCDKHPDYYTTSLAAEIGLPVLKLQHHLAHAHACIAEHALEGPLTALVWDGSGFGLDGHTWGGECFHIDGATMQRRFTLLPFKLPGGERAVKEPRRSAAGAMYTTLDDALFTNHTQRLGQFTNEEIPILQQMLKRSINAPATTSIGRLFDAIASLAGLVQVSSHEAQAPMLLETMAWQSKEQQPYAMEFSQDCHATSSIKESATHIDWRPMLLAVLQDVDTGTAPKAIAARFMATLCSLVVILAKKLGNRQVVLSGGCFQNRLLTENSIIALRDAGFTPFWHERIPPNDGGLAFGQAAWGCTLPDKGDESCV